MRAMVSDSVRRLNPGLFGGPEPQRRPAEIAHIERRTRADGLNKSETAVMQIIRRLHAGKPHVLISQPSRLFELEGGGTYTPDFIVFTPQGTVVYEVKGGYRGPGAEHGVERFKRAAAQWAGPSIVFVLAVRDKSAAGGWRMETWENRDGKQ